MPGELASTLADTAVSGRDLSAAVSREAKPGGSVSNDRKRWLLDSLLLICMLLVVIIKCNIPASGMDEDIWWHMSTGDWILKNHAVPTHDVFATYTMGSPWIAYSWLFDVLTAKLYGAWGLQGILALTMLLTISFVSTVVLLLSRNGRMLRAIVLSAIVFAATATLIAPRPWLFTCNFAVIELYLLLQAREYGKVVWLTPLLPLFALWANLHIQFVYGLAVIGIFAMEQPLAALLKRERPDGALPSRYFWLVLIGSVSATLINPYGWRLYQVVAQYATQAAPLKVVQEMHAMDFRSVTDWAALFLVCYAAFSSALSGRRRTLMISLLVVCCWFGFRAGRDVWFLSVISAFVITHSTGSAAMGLGRIRLAQWAISLPVALGLAFAVLHSPGISPGALQEAAAKKFPVRACDFIQDQGLQGPLYNTYGWGGYLIWRLPLPVSIDGRANLHGDVRLSRYVDTWSGHRNWAEDVELRNARTILLEHESPLASILSSDARFRLVYDDTVASVFQTVTR